MQDETQLLEKIDRGVTALDERTKSLATTQEKMLLDYDRLDKTTKTAFEDLTKAKNALNDFSVIIQKMEAVQVALKHERRMAIGDPVERFCADEEKRNFLNAIARRLAFPNAKLPEHLERALTGVDSSLGAALIPTHYIPEIYDVLSEYGAYNTLNVMRVGARTNSLPIMSARPTAAWYGAGAAATEGTAIGDSSYTGSAVSLSIQTLGALLYVSREQLQDSTADMAAPILRDLGMAIAYALDFTAFQSDATADATDAGYTGLFAVVAAVHTGLATTPASATAVADTTLADWNSCLITVTEGVLNRPCKWWMHPQILAKVCRVVDLSGRPIFQTALEAPSATIGSIFGYPVVRVAAAPSTDAASAKVAVFGDPQAYVVAIRQDMDLAMSEHIKFAENMIGYRATIRAGTKLRVPTSNPAGFKPITVFTLHS